MSWQRQRVNFIVFSTVNREEREIITRYVFSFSFKKWQNSSVQRKLGSRYPDFQAGERRFEKTIAEEGGGGGGGGVGMEKRRKKA